MRTDILNPKDLFQKDVHYTIPPFQRPYVWNQDDQWEPLWEDARNRAEDYLEQLELTSDRVEAQQRTSAHFMGAVVLKQVPTATRDIAQREVIDGQQRMTTLQLLLDAIQQICEESDLKMPGRRLSKLVTNDSELIGVDRSHIFKLWPTRVDREAFRHAMDNGLAVNDFEKSLIVQAHEFFQEQVRKWLADGEESIDDKAEALETAVTDLLQMVVIDLDARDDPNVIFETLNARGTPLEQSDLIKNFVLSDGRGTDVWGSLDDEWWRKEVSQGRLRRPRLDMLLNYWLAMRTGSEVSPTSVFDAFRRHCGERGIEEVMSEAKSDLDRYRLYETGAGRTPREDLFHYRTGVMQAGVITPVMLVLLSAERRPRERALDAIESFLIRRMVCRATTKDYNRLTLDMAVRLRESGLEKADATVVEFLKGQEAYARWWPSDNYLAEQLEFSPLYRLLTRGRLRLALEGIESQLRSEMTEQVEPPKYLTIEHLMPQSWGGSWPLPEDLNDADGELATQRRNRLIHSIGNLTLVNNKLNSKLSNGPWMSKRDALQEHSVLKLNSELLKATQWDEESIRRRSRRMAQLLSKYWPGRDSHEWTF